MDTSALKKFAQAARNQLIDQVKSKLDLVLDQASVARREAPKAVKDLETAIRKIGQEQVIEQVAYTWFNRFTALRFMDANSYTLVRVVSPAEGATRPEILSEAMAGNLPDKAPTSIEALLNGRAPSNDPQAEAYRLLLVHTCNQLHGPMPFLFEQIDDYTELLMPEDLLSQSSILAELRKVMTERACQDVEIIGWLYQFYISEKKDQVFAGLKKNQKITAENIPAATQLFTPHWIVRYLVENSLGRLWLLNNPQSGLAAKMDYYIAPEEPETDFLKITKPEEIRICDPAAGSGHMLTYAFDLLYAIYEEEGYDATEIPALILTHNLTGVEIDDRAGALAAFALAMKAAAKLGRRRFLRMAAKPDICVLQNVSFLDTELDPDSPLWQIVPRTDEVVETLGQFKQAKNFGSLIVPKLRNPAEAVRVVEARDFGGDLLLKEVQARVLAVLGMAEALSPKYHVVVANPPYMGSRGMNNNLSNFVGRHTPDSKSDLFACFIERALELTRNSGFCALVTMQSWMFLSTYEKLREKIGTLSSISTMAHMGNMVMGIAFGTAATVFHLRENLSKKGAYLYVDYEDLGENGEPLSFPPKNDRNATSVSEDFFHWASSNDFKAIPGMPISYWLSDSIKNAFLEMDSIGHCSLSSNGIQTGNNGKFVRQWHEVDIGNSFQRKKWIPYNKGGPFRKWYGNNEYFVNWMNNGKEIRSQSNCCIRGEQKYFEPGITWSDITSGPSSFKFFPKGHLFDAKGPSAFFEASTMMYCLGFLNCKLVAKFTPILNPSLSFQIGEFRKLPLASKGEVHGADQVSDNAKQAVVITQSDWDAQETSWDFTTLPLLQPDHRAGTLEATYTTLRTHWQGLTDEMLTLEEENNRIFIDAYGLQDELTPEVPLNEITLTCNPAYRYGIKNDAVANETRLLADTMAEFLSYAVGCMFGRYSLDAPGLILANQGETLQEYLARVPESRFMPDEDNVIPVLDADWFPDDITERFRLFLRTTFGEAHFRENLRYIEDALGKDIRKYFTKDFYADHVKRYKKRPIYWMFSSPKGTFNALIYMHRYRSDTASVLLNHYLREFITKLEGERTRLDKLVDDPTTTQSQKTKAIKVAGLVAKQIDELNEWEDEVIFPLAQQKIEIDLDAGVKVNYPKLGAALKKIAGLEAKDD